MIISSQDTQESHKPFKTSKDTLGKDEMMMSNNMLVIVLNVNASRIGEIAPVVSYNLFPLQPSPLNEYPWIISPPYPNQMDSMQSWSLSIFSLSSKSLYQHTPQMIPLNLFNTISTAFSHTSDSQDQ